MSSNSKKTGPAAPFDVKTVEALVALMAANDLSEIYLRDGNQHVRLRRGTSPVVVSAAAPTAAAMHAAPATTAKPAADPAPAAAPGSAKKHLTEIKSETVGTFYAQPKPGDPPYVKLGDRVTPTTPVAMIVVMKTNNEILANCAGTVVEILAKDEQFVDFGQVLFRVDPS